MVLLVLSYSHGAASFIAPKEAAWTINTLVIIIMLTNKTLRYYSTSGSTDQESDDVHFYECFSGFKYLLFYKVMAVCLINYFFAYF